MTVVAERLDHIRGLKPGWLDGKGYVPEVNDLDWLKEQFDLYYPIDLEPPYLYPTPEGGVLIEWPSGKEDISLEMEFVDHTGFWHQLNMKTGIHNSRELNLDDQEDWRWLINKIKSN